MKCFGLHADHSRYKMRFADCHPNLKHHAKGLCQNCYAREYSRRGNAVLTRQKYKDVHREEYRQYGRELHQKHRQLCLDHYGHKCACPNCPETMDIFIEIDHINNDGEDHRKNDKEANHLYRWLIKNDFPSGFQSLCSNCNQAKRRHGKCPHMEVENA